MNVILSASCKLCNKKAAEFKAIGGRGGDTTRLPIETAKRAFTFLEK